MKYSITKSTRRRDKRGFLVDFLKLDELVEKDKIFGQAYCITFETPRAVRGNHYHTGKKEWFVAIKGRLKVVLEDVKTKEHVEFILDGDRDEYKRIEISENIAHAFKNISRTAVMINYCNKPYHPEDPDSIHYKLL